ncbi:ABC transporter permease/substrate-binding protein [Comamonas sp. B21-038]|uniref:ABC transporter permease/substrate-binding protein n=1 Tax=Comamonas sp. B21-038 TaxID=2918299 RepID=UPI001EFC0F93|nr:glycine betaine ABC transporter substrate-binding protein [Comamonas sp. B21-038]ULR89201.1 ABC transporter permease subunit [Comamonas sp. B21-038]
MLRLHHLMRFALVWVLGLLAASAAGAAQEETLRVGSKRFTESYVLAEIMAQQAQAAGVKTQVRQGLGNTAIVYEALRSGQIDVYAEYSGTIALEIAKHAQGSDLASLNAALAPLGLAVGVPLGFNDGYALAMRRQQAEALGIRSLSDLARHSELRFGLSNEFIGRGDGWPGLAKRYNLQAKPQGLDHGLAYEAITQQHIDVMDIYTTDAKIDHLGLWVLEDDQAYFPRYDALLLYRQDLPTQKPVAWAALQQLQGRISEAAMIGMNAQAELQGRGFAEIAKQFLAGGTAQTNGKAAVDAKAAGQPSLGARLWTRLVAPDLWRLTAQHLALVLVSVGVAALIAVPAGILLFPHPRSRALALGAAGVLQTIPSLALLAVLIAWFGVIGRLPALVALTAYSILPILSNTCAGLAEVSPGLRSAGSALGMTRPQRMRWVELPIAMPTVVAGIRTACAIGIGTATIAAFIGAGGLGERIVTGLALNDSALMLAGALPAAALALLSELLFELWERYLRRRRVRR